MRAIYPHLPRADRARPTILAEVGDDAREMGDVAVVPVFGGREAPKVAQPGVTDDTKWFNDHYSWAADQVVRFLGDDGFSLEGRQVADIGCGDGIIDLGLFRLANPERLVGFDVNPVDLARLSHDAEAAGVDGTLPKKLEFTLSEQRALPAEDHCFDVVFSWSAFEHIRDPEAVLREVHRTLKPDGVLMIQLWPFYASRMGSHLWPWFPEGWVQHLCTSAEIQSALRAAPGPDPVEVRRMFQEYTRLNGASVDDLQRCLLAAGFAVTKLELISDPVRIPQELSRLPLSLLGISGVKLLAVPAGR